MGFTPLLAEGCTITVRMSTRHIIAMITAKTTLIIGNETATHSATAPFAELTKFIYINIILLSFD
jgi:hypothetical protein